MRILIELDGAVIDMEPAHWSAYHRVAGELGLARVDRATYRRSLRRGDSAGKVLRGARPDQIRQFQAQFAQVVESDEALAQCDPQPDVAADLGRLTRLAACVLITTGRNRTARQKHLDAADLSVHFARMASLSSQQNLRPSQLSELADEDLRAIVAASTPEVVHAGVSAGMTAVGVSNGVCSPRRLTQAGACVVYSDLAVLADEIEAGAPQLVGHGLLPASTDHTGGAAGPANRAW